MREPVAFTVKQIPVKEMRMAQQAAAHGRSARGGPPAGAPQRWAIERPRPLLDTREQGKGDADNELVH